MWPGREAVNNQKNFFFFGPDAQATWEARITGLRMVAAPDMIAVMAGDLRKYVLDQLDRVLGQYSVLQEKSEFDDCSDLPRSEGRRVITLACAAIARSALPGSTYVNQMQAIESRAATTNEWFVLPLIIGVVGALRADVEAGYVKSAGELLRGDLFADFLEMAQHLLDEGYKDAAAVIAGSSLEAHLRQLCAKAGIDTETQGSTGSRPKKAETMNADLTKAGVYSKLEQKSVTAWLGLRNSAAHGDYDDYTGDQVALMVSGIRNFITRYPA